MNPSIRSRQIFNGIWSAIKWAVFLIVLAFVARHAWMLWNRLDETPWRFHGGWFALAALLSVAAWAPSVWYWRLVMSSLGAAAPWQSVIRAYYCGNLGKYLPGKAAVIVIRAALLRPFGVPATTAAVAVTHETLTCMWAGVISVLLLYPILAMHLPEWITEDLNSASTRIVSLVSVVCGGAAVLTTLACSHRWMRKSAAAGPDPVEPPHLTVFPALRLAVSGGGVFLAAWWIQGLTLGLTIRSVIGDRAAWSDWPLWTGTAAIAVVGGFLAVFAPAGMGVREGLVLELLERQIGPREAVLVTLLWRGASLAGEILAAGALYYGVEGVKTVEESKG